MPKRKLDTETTSFAPSKKHHTDSTTVQRFRVERQLDHGKKTLFRALKVARGFERQKLGRRQKTATKEKDADASKRLVEEVKALKALDLEMVAESHLSKQMLKTKRIREAPAFPEKYVLGLRTHAQVDDATKNVLSRLYSSNPAKEATNEIMNSIRDILGLSDAKDGSDGKQRKATDGRKKKIEKSDEEPRDLGSEADDGDLEEDEEADEADDISLNSDDLAHLGVRVVGSSDEGSDADQSDPGDLDPNEITTEEEGDQENDELEEEDDDDDDDDEQEDDIFISSEPTPPSASISISTSPPPKAPKPPKSQPHPAPPPKDTTFLPTLMAGYISGSNSSSLDSADDQFANIQPRKNRRGQRARQVINEKKYGTQAHHLKKENVMKGGRGGDGWDMRRGAVEEGGGRRGGRFSGGYRKGGFENPASASGNKTRTRRSEHGGGGGSNGNGGNPNTISNAPKGKLHPSWEAARKAKEQKMNATFQGKKIVFD
ncbi:MAG: hypothetical protein M1834_006106 [Cirrosporium novae-zelandiae]|nr:MAG: hypothetical protein M1834_006106 [Cirrosporium novae-zelandiae]